MSDKFELKAILSANAEGLLKGLKSVEAPAKAARKYLLDIGKSAGGLGAKLGLPMGLAGGLAASLGAAKIKDAVKNFAELGETIERGVARTGLSASAYMQWSAVAESAGIDADTLGKSMFKLQSNVGKAYSGMDKGMAKFLDQSGIAWRKMAADTEHGTGDLMVALAGRLEQVKNPAQRTALEMKLMGKQAVELAPLFGKGAEGIRQMMEHINKFKPPRSDAAIKEQIESSNRLKLAFFDMGMASKGFQQTIAAGLAPGIAAVASQFASLVAGGKKVFSSDIAGMAKQIGKAIEEWANNGGVQRLLDSVKWLGGAMAGLVRMVGGPRNALIGLAIVINARTIVAVGQLIGSIARAGFAFLIMAARATLSMAGMDASVINSMGPMKLLGSAAVNMGGALKAAFGMGVSGIKMFAKGFVSMGRMMLTSPVGIALAGIAVAAYLIYRNWDTVKQWFAGFWGWMKAHADTILMCLGPIGWVAKAIMSQWGAVKQWFGSTFDWLASKVKWALDAAQTVGKFLGLGGDSGKISVEQSQAGAPDTGARGEWSDALAQGRGMQLPTSRPERRHSILPSSGVVARVEGQVNIKISGLPQGSRVEQTQGGTMPINIDAGYSSYAMGMP